MTARSTAPAPRRRRLSADQRREQIVAATVSVLATHGYQATTADAISRSAGVSKGLLWHYFANLDELMHETARLTVAQLRRAVGAGLDLSAPAPDVIRAAVHGAAGLRRTHGAERRAMQEIIINLRTPDGTQRLSQADYDETYAEQEKIFRRGQADGDFRDTLNPRLMAVTYQGAVDAMLGYLDAHPEIDADEHAEVVADILLGGMCPPR